MKMPPFKNKNCHYDYENKCDCSEDDKCGCTFPNNLPHDYSKECFEEELLNAEETIINETAAAPTNETASPTASQPPFHPAVGNHVPNFTAPAILNDDTLIEHFDFYKYTEGKNAVLFFYPEDFSFTCPSELLLLNKNLSAFTNRNTRVLGISTDSIYSHLAWKQMPPEKDGISDISFPLIADLDKHISKLYNVLSKKETARRATIVIDAQKIIRHIAVYDMKIWRSPDEIIRIIDIINQKNDNITACPKGWKQNFFFERPEPETILEIFSHREIY